ncbi:MULTISPECIES: DUF47 domain-containing protein [Anaerosinus]|jgi:uncharacterized protein|uniref:DUF47 family protein n=1 Tax=Selenobaculum gibii TaxID=3054208 RepID=A0A9Y2ADT9_9FIRM|nr:DUF47 family protein [Selenobaculum gbiensis]WIW69700.1 DUF47 family protein [Selenobaculum gbiensis]
MFNFSFKHKDDEFFDLFIESAKFFHAGALKLHTVVSDYSQAEKLMKDIIEIEHKADDINEKIIDKLNQTFITPIDREDIYALANKLDDGVDFLQGTVQRIVLYKTGDSREGTIELAKLLIRSTEELLKALELLKDIKKNQHAILDCTRNIENIESEGDRIYRKEVAHLFESTLNPIEVIKWKEVLEFLEDTLDRCEDTADLLRGVVMKYA